MSVLRSALVPALAALAIQGCGGAGSIDAVTIEPRTLTAGSDEEWYVRVEASPSEGRLEPDVVGLLVLHEDGSLEPALGGTSWWSLLDGGYWGDSVGRDFVFERRALHPFRASVPPGIYVVTVTGGYPIGEWPEPIEITILPPP